MSQRIRLCKTSELQPDQCGEIEITLDDGRLLPLFYIRLEDTIRCFINSCPHTGAMLNWNPGVFLDREKQFYLCSLHGALFEKDNGHCVAGPCAGQSLTALSTELEKGIWYAVLPGQA